MVVLAGGGPGAFRALADPQPFEIPEGFIAVPDTEIAASGDWQGLITVRPTEGAFADLSAIRLRRVTGRIVDADGWLKERLRGDVVDEGVVRDLLDSPDSPFSDPLFDSMREAIPHLFRGLEKLSKLPLDFCEGPVTAYNSVGSLRELFCVYQVGPFRHYLVLRLQNAGSNWYFTEIRAMNERRLRHLIAIANSFRLTD
jgi:hypothetical protein